MITRFYLEWVGKRGRTSVICLLDRAVRNEDWHEKFPPSPIQYLHMWGSNHRPFLANVLVKPVKARKKIKFDKWWLDSEEIRQVIFEGRNLSNLPADANIMAHISSCC